MANTVAYTSTNSPTGSLKKGVISINLNNQIIGQNYNWRNGIVFQNQYIIYSDTFTQGIDTEANAKPCAWSCDYNDTALLNLINSLPPLIGQTKYSTLADAIGWLEGQGKYFIVNQNYPTIVTDGLIFCTDAGMTGSFPLIGDKWYDISANGYVTLLNSPLYSNSGSTSFITFDGTDDSGSTNINYSSGSGGFTVSLWVNPSSWVLPSCPCTNTGGFIDWSTGFWNYFAIFGNLGGPGAALYSDPSAPGARISVGFNYSTLNRWVNLTVTFANNNPGTLTSFTNGQSANSSTLEDSITITAPFSIASFNRHCGNCFVPAKFGKILAYNRPLTPTEVLQNYYQGPIVTSGLVATYDSGNLVSYPGTSTTWYDMAGTDNGTLINGITYTINSGGILNFDGSDDYVQVSSTLGNPGTSDFTYTVWWKANGTQSGFASLISQGFTGSIASGGWALKVINNTNQNFVSFSYASATETIVDVVTSTNANDGQWHLIGVKRSGTNCTLYMDGVSIGTFTLSSGFSFGTGANTFIGYTPRDAAFILGNLGIVMKYNRAISDSEMLQNYYAHLNRFQSNQAFAIGGTVSSVIENGVKYRVHTFTSSGTLTVLSSGKVEALVVAGGGGGGRGRGGGGGAGGYIYDTDYSVGTGNKTVTVGAGGAGGSVNSSTAPNGSNSVFDNLTSIGGGGGAGTLAVVNSALNGASGGSGGGGSGNSSTPGPGGVGGDGTASQGFKGGASFSDNASYTAGGGGGGAGGEGNSSVLNNSGNGGVGRQNSISGSASFYAAGGGGGGDGSAIAGSGGSSIGGNGSSSTVGGNATVNTGSGGGGGAASQNGGAGGSGIVIIRYRI
jgi:hypothetical protein